MTTAPARTRPSGRARRPEPQNQRLTFLRSFLRSPSKIGAVLPTSKRFCRYMTRSVDWKPAKFVVEFGPGTGVVTDELLPLLPSTCRYMGVELDAALCRIFRQRHPGVLLHRGSAADIERIARAEGFGPIDVIISGLPWASFKRSLQDTILSAAHRALKPGGKFLTFGYQIGEILPAGRRFYKDVVPGYFDDVKKSGYVWRNLPPAFFITCTKNAGSPSTLAK